jgi:selenocysteine lyase/cysteine desulfurase
MKVTEAQEMWSPATTYLNTASYGLPPRPAWDALQSALDDWHGGRTSWEHWGIPGEDARASFARLVGVPVESVAIGPNVSTLVGLVAASIPDGSRVLAPEVEFTSELFPFLVQEHRGVTTRLVPQANWLERSGRTSTLSRSVPCRCRQERSRTSTQSQPRPPSTAR